MNAEKNRSNSITSLQSMSNDNIAYQNEDRGETGNALGRGKQTQQSMRSIKKAGYDESNLVAQKKKKEGDQPSVSIVPGYKNFILDENNAAYDSITDMFTKEEIDQAFKILDYQGNNQITVEELTFFLESIGEQAKPEEIEEMIKMCDLEGKGFVSKDEFVKLASGQSLAPIGQAYPPTEEMLRKKEILENINLDDFQMQRYKHATDKKQPQGLKVPKKMPLPPIQGNQSSIQQDQVPFQGINNNAQKTNPKQLTDNTSTSIVGLGGSEKQKQLVGQSQALTTVLNTTATNNKPNQQGGTQQNLTIQQKKEAQNKMRIYGKWQKENKITPEKLVYLVKQINDIQKEARPDEEIVEFQKEYKGFIKFLGLTDGPQHQGVFKLAQSQQADPNSQRINMFDFVFLMIASTDMLSNGKYDLSFQMLQKDAISLDDLFYIERKLTLQDIIPEEKIRSKFINQKNKKEYKGKINGNDEMDKQFYLELIASYPGCFQA